MLTDGTNISAIPVAFGAEKNSGMDRGGLANLTAFVAVADHLSFRGIAAAAAGRPRPSDRWHPDEMVVRIAGKRMYLWHAVDHEGEILDMLVQRRRDSG